LERDYQALRSGGGRWSDTLEGATAGELIGARDSLGTVRRAVEAPNTRRRDRRAATKSLDSVTAAVDAAERRWQKIGQPVAEQLQRAITTARRDIDPRSQAQASEHIVGAPVRPSDLRRHSGNWLALPTELDEGAGRRGQQTFDGQRLSADHEDLVASHAIGQRELRTDSAEIVRRVNQGETFIVTRNGIPVAEMIAATSNLGIPGQGSGSNSTSYWRNWLSTLTSTRSSARVWAISIRSNGSE
jgi:prevent-host-death family protein